MDLSWFNARVEPDLSWRMFMTISSTAFVMTIAVAAQLAVTRDRVDRDRVDRDRVGRFPDARERAGAGRRTPAILMRAQAGGLRS